MNTNLKIKIHEFNYDCNMINNYSLKLLKELEEKTLDKCYIKANMKILSRVCLLSILMEHRLIELKSEINNKLEVECDISEAVILTNAYESIQKSLNELDTKIVSIYKAYTLYNSIYDNSEKDLLSMYESNNAKFDINKLLLGGL